MVPFGPAEPYRFCPVDATPLEKPRRPAGGARCPRCGRSWYRTSSPTVGCVVLRDGRALVAVRGIEPEKGRLDVPGGFLEPGEHPLDGLRREVREELGVEIEDIRGPLVMETHTYGEGGAYVLALGFAARLRGDEDEPTPADDVAEIRWVSAAELDALDFAWEHDRELVRRALSHPRA